MRKKQPKSQIRVLALAAPAASSGRDRLAAMIITLALALVFLAAGRGMAQDEGGLQASLEAMDSIPQWNWNWVDDLRDGASQMAPVPVSLNPTMGLQYGLGGPMPISTTSKDVDEPGSLLGLLERPESGGVSGNRLGDMITDTLNTSFFSMGSRLEFHVSKRFLPYVGGGLVYPAAENPDRSLDFAYSSPGWEVGLGFAFSQAPMQFVLNALYRGWGVHDDRNVELRMDESCPTSFDASGCTVSCGLSFAF